MSQKKTRKTTRLSQKPDENQKECTKKQVANTKKY